MQRDLTKQLCMSYLGVIEVLSVCQNCGHSKYIWEVPERPASELDEKSDLSVPTRSLGGASCT